MPKLTFATQRGTLNWASRRWTFNRSTRRSKSSQSSSKPPETTKPTNHPTTKTTLTNSTLFRILTSPLRLYNQCQNRRPYVTQFFTSITIYLLGDVSSQYVRRPLSPSPAPSFASTYDPTRSLRNMLIGGLASIPSYCWFLYLGTIHNYPSSTLLSLGAKVAITQLCFTPVFNSYYFAMQSLLAGLIPSPEAEARPASLLEDPAAALAEAGVRVRETVPLSWYNSCFFWPPVTAMLYRFARPQDRSALAGIVAVGWQTYLGLLNQRAAEKEAREGVDGGR